MKLSALVWRSQLKYPGFSLWRGMFNPQDRKLRRRSGSPIRRSSLEVKTTNGIVSALTNPNFGMLNRQTESSSSNIASNAWDTLSSSSINKTHRSWDIAETRSNGPALKNFRLWRSCLSGSHSTGRIWTAIPPPAAAEASSNLPMAFSSLIPSKHCNRSTSVLVALAMA